MEREASTDPEPGPARGDQMQSLRDRVPDTLARLEGTSVPRRVSPLR